MVNSFYVALRIFTLTFLLLSFSAIAYAQSLHQAAAKGDIEEVKALISKGADVNEKDRYGATPLHHATNHWKEVLRPIEGQSGKKDWNVFSLDSDDSIREGYLDLIKFLISKGADVNARDDSNGFIPLHVCALSGTLNVAKFLVSQGADINAKDNNGLTPVELAEKQSSKFSKEVARYLRDVAKSKIQKVKDRAKKPERQERPSQ